MELLSFPQGKYDDQVDSISQALSYEVSGSDGSLRWVNGKYQLHQVALARGLMQSRFNCRSVTRSQRSSGADTFGGRIVDVRYGPKKRTSSPDRADAIKHRRHRCRSTKAVGSS